MTDSPLNVLIVSPTASLQFGGEASLPYYYFKLMNERGVNAHLLVHDRTRAELQKAFPDRLHQLHFVNDTGFEKFVTKLGRPLPAKISAQTTGIFRDVSTQFRQRAMAKKLVKDLKIDVVFEPSRISPKQTSALFHLDAPLVIGPLCGGIDFPPAFQYMHSTFARWLERGGRAFAHLLNFLIPGKLLADALIVANDLTARALPAGVHGRVYEVVESGVDLDIWKPQPVDRTGDDKVRFVFAGRIVDWKGVQFLIEAFAKVAARVPNARLEIIGTGPLQEPLTQRVAELGLAEHVRFAGWLSRPDGAVRLRSSDVFVMPSLHECGGTAILEALAMGLPVIATNWGGPGNYVDATCGVLVAPTSKEAFIDGLANAMVQLAESKELREKLRAGALQRINSGYWSWAAKTDRVIEILHEVVARQ
jgi:glycosyltransferase involved in cell wall biosynthesis